MLMPHDVIALRIFGSVPEFDHQLEIDERAKIARTRKNIDLHEQELLQNALIEEKQVSL